MIKSTLMLWQMPDEPKGKGVKKVSLAEHILSSAAYYKEKYGGIPTVCYLHPETLADGHIESSVVNGIALRTKSMSKKCLLIGVEV